MMMARLRNEDGNILIITVLVSLLVGAMASLTLTTGEQADRSSARDRNRDIALGVAEAGIHETTVVIEDLAAASYILPNPGDEQVFTGQTNEGDWEATVTRIPDDQGFVIDAVATTGTDNLRRRRRVQVEMRPPDMFPGEYALYSERGIVLKNGDQVLEGDVWTDGGGVQVQNGVTVNGSVTSATGWIHLENGSSIRDFAQTGGISCDTSATPCTSGWALKHDGSSIGKFAKLSVSEATCPPEPAQSAYKAIGNGSIGGDLTAWSTTAYAGTVGGTRTQGGTAGCTKAPAPLGMPTFTFNPINYPSVQQLTPAQFNALDGDQSGVFYVPSVTGVPVTQLNRLDLGGWHVDGDILIVTDYPVSTNGIDEADDLESAVFVVVSHYSQSETPPVNPYVAGCEVNNDNSDCAIHAKNDFSFDGSHCKTAVLLYADNGAIAIKNNANNPGEPDVCGAFLGSTIEIKNNQKLMYDERIARYVGFGPKTLVIARWEELPVG